MNARFERQADFVPQDRLADLTITVIGIGAIGDPATSNDLSLSA